jgi:hypothetical protein
MIGGDRGHEVQARLLGAIAHVDPMRPDAEGDEPDGLGPFGVQKFPGFYFFSLSESFRLFERGT